MTYLALRALGSSCDLPIWILMKSFEPAEVLLARAVHLGSHAQSAGNEGPDVCGGRSRDSVRSGAAAP